MHIARNFSLVLPRLRATLWAAATAAAATIGCAAQSSAPIAPIGTGSHATSTPSSGSSALAITAFPLASPPAGTDITDLTYLESQLPVSMPVPADRSGALGTVVSVGPSSFTLQQVPITSATSAAQVGAVDFAILLPVGNLTDPLTVTTTSATTFAGVSSLSELKPGDLVATGGTANAGSIAAVFVLAILQPLTLSSHTFTGANATASAVWRSVEPATVRKLQSVSTTNSVTDILQWKQGAGDAFLLGQGQNVGSCLNINQVLSGTDGENFQLQMPFTISWNYQPPGYTALNGGGYDPPNPLSDWMTFVPQPGSTNAPTAFATFGLGIGFSYNVTDTCAPGKGNYALTQLRFGYRIVSSSASPMPGVGQSISLNANSCLQLFPLPLPIAASVAQLNGPVSISLCDPAVISGQYLYADIDKVTGGTTNVTSIMFDPALAPAVPNPGLISPTAAQMSFTFENYLYPATWTDKGALKFGNGPFTSSDTLPLPFFDAPITITGVTASPVPIAISVQGTPPPLIVTPATATLSVGQSVQLTPSLAGYTGPFVADNDCPGGAAITESPAAGTQIPNGSSVTVTYATPAAIRTRRIGIVPGSLPATGQRNGGESGGDGDADAFGLN